MGPSPRHRPAPGDSSEWRERSGVDVVRHARTLRQFADQPLDDVVERCDLVSPDVQRRTYATSEGQPAHRAAWTDPAADKPTHGFFPATPATLATPAALDAAYLRPRHLRFVAVQTRAGERLHHFLAGGDHDPDRVRDELDALHRRAGAA